MDETTDNAGSGGIYARAMRGDWGHRHSDVRLIGAALAKGWNLTPEMRDKCKDVLLAVLDAQNASWNTKISAVRCFALLDAIDARRERTQAGIDVAELREQTARLAGALGSPKYAELFDQLAADLLPQDQPALPQPPSAEGQAPPPGV
jgi:hypothetical protein